MKRAAIAAMTRATLAAVGLASPGCAVNKALPAGDLFSSHPPVEESAGLRIAGYTTSDGKRHRFEGFASVIGDSVVLHHPAHPGHGLERNEPAVSLRLSRDELTALDATHTDLTRSVVVAILLTLVVIPLIYLVSFSQGPT